MNQLWGFTTSSGDEEEPNDENISSEILNRENIDDENNRTTTKCTGKSKRGNNESRNYNNDNVQVNVTDDEVIGVNALGDKHNKDTFDDNNVISKKNKNSRRAGNIDEDSHEEKTILEKTMKKKKRENKKGGDKPIEHIHNVTTTDNNFLSSEKNKHILTLSRVEKKKDNKKDTHCYDITTDFTKRKEGNINLNKNSIIGSSVSNRRGIITYTKFEKGNGREDTTDEELLKKQKMYKEKMNLKKDFMDAVHEIRKLTLPHLNKFQRKNVENYQIKTLGGKFDKSRKIHYPELMCRKKSMKKYIKKRKEREKILGVKFQSGDYIDMQDVFRKKKKKQKYQTAEIILMKFG
ncbi:hypothetical protein MKS88_004086 [Plasmodium brasilianum]|uniref:Uncharacterized protein n=1 Tax=Plasmodium brasilianum TaxID=5824 RepID=A0ACB9Y3T6_PLABR|nr:hypothetical protein MKS88_004086 [Plasmodium brasilianum]